MVLTFETLLTRQRRLDAERRQKYVQQFRLGLERFSSGSMQLVELCATAGRALEGYAAETAEVFCDASETDHDRATRLAAEYRDGIASVAAAIRDAVADTSIRHAVAQTLQERLIRAEMRCRVSEDAIVERARRF